MNVAKKQNARTEKASIFTSPRMRRLVWLRLYRNRYIYLMILPVIVYFILLKYVPMWFLRSAFYDYKLRLGFEGSKYVGLKYFERLFTNPNLLNYIGNTLKLNIAALVILFPMPVIFAIMLNEMRNVKFMKFVQTISYLPHFVSTVVVVGMLNQIMTLTGARGLLSLAVVTLPAGTVKRLCGLSLLTVTIKGSHWKTSLGIVVSTTRYCPYGSPSMRMTPSSFVYSSVNRYSAS